MNKNKLDFDGDIILVRGLSGSGKTTFSNLIKTLDDVVVAADDYMIDESGEYKFNLYKLNLCHKKCKEKVENEMKKNTKKIFVHNTFTEEWEMKPYKKMAEKYNYRLFSIIVENRHNNTNIHNVSEEMIKKQRKRFIINL